MDKVKQFWKDVLKEREDYWCSFFRKYEEEDQNADVNSYMENSSSRIATLLKIASVGEHETLDETGAPQIQHFYEEQPSDEHPDKDNQSRPLTPNALAITDLIGHSANTYNFLSTPQKKFEPSFIMEILDDEEEKEAKIQLSPGTKKFKLFSSSILSETNNHGSRKSLNCSLGEHCTEQLEWHMEDRKVNISFNVESVKYICKRRRFHSNNEVSTPKRFKLA